MKDVRLLGKSMAPVVTLLWSTVDTGRVCACISAADSPWCADPGLLFPQVPAPAGPLSSLP